MKQLILLLFIFILSCYSPSIVINEKKSSTSKKNASVPDKRESEQKKEILSDEFVYLFFDKSSFVKKPVILPKEQKPVIVEINSNDYKVIVDWQFEGGRSIRLKNIKTGKEYVVKDSDKTGEIVLIERSLFYYKFKIGNTIIKVKK